MGAEVTAFLSHASRAASMASTTFRTLEKSLPYKAPPAMTVSGQYGSKPIRVAADDWADEREGDLRTQPYSQFVHDQADASLRLGFSQASS